MLSIVALEAKGNYVAYVLSGDTFTADSPQV